MLDSGAVMGTMSSLDMYGLRVYGEWCGVVWRGQRGIRGLVVMMGRSEGALTGGLDAGELESYRKHRGICVAGIEGRMEGKGIEEKVKKELSEVGDCQY